MRKLVTEVVLVVRSHFERHGWWHPNLGMWLVALGAEQRYKVVVQSICGAPNPASSANIGAEVFLRDYPDAEWLGIVDNDCVPPDNMLRILDDLTDDVAVVGPVSHMAQHDQILLQQGWRTAKLAIADKAVDGLLEVDVLGGGCWFARRRVLNVMTMPYFAEEYHPNHMIKTSDDVYFQYRAKELGFRLFCDTRFIVQHYHTLDLSKATLA